MVNRNIIEDLLLEVSVYHPIINFQEKEQVETLIWICEQKGHQNLIPFIKETFLNEASAGEEAKKRGLVHLGRGYYGKEKGKPATFKTEKGKLVAVKPGEETPAAKTEPIVKGEPTPKDVKPNKEKDLTATEKPLETPTQSDDTEIDSQKAKKDHDTAIEDPEKILNDPQASMRSKAVARSQQSKNAVTQADAPSKDSDAKGEFKPNPELQPQTDEKGNVAGTEIPTEVKENPDPEFVGKIATKMDEFGEKVIAEEERAQQSVIDQMKKEGKLPADFKTVGGREMGFGFKHPALKDNPELQKELGDRIKKENKPPHWNLCEVSIPGTNKFCDENIGIPRDKMPQLSGKPKPGSAGEAKAKKVAEEKVKKKMGISIDQPVPDDRKAEYDELYSKENISHVNVEQEFEDELKAQGIAVSPPVEVPASSLKATQSELVGEQVVGMVDALEEDPNNPFITAPIMVTKDGYVIDGHHRWAAIQAYNMKHAAPNGSKPPIAMKVRIVDEDIETHIPRANAFAEKMGIETMSGKAKGGAEKAEPVAAQKVSEPEEKKTEKPKEGDEYSKGTRDYRPKEEPKVTNDKLGAKAKTQGGKILYHIGGGYYSDTPGGTAKYIRVESVVEKAIESDSPNWWKLLFEADVKGSVEGGEEGLFRPIPKGQQDAATKHGKKEAEKQSQSTDGTGEVPSPQPSQTTQEPEKVAPKSMKDAIFTHSKEKNDEKKQQTIEKKLEQSNQQLLKTAQKSAESAKKKGVRTKKGVIYLETEPGSGKFQEYNVKDVYTSLNKLLNGEKLLKSDIRNLNGVVKLVTNPENGEVKIYFAAKFVGRHPQQGYESVQLASAKNFEMASAIREFAKSKGLNVGKSSEGALGKKVLTPLKFGQSINPNNPSKPVEIKQTPNGVSVDGNEIKKLKEPNEEKLVQKLISKGLSEEDARQQAKKAVLQTRAFNQRLDDLVAAANNPENETPGMIPMVNFGDVTTPEGRKQTIDNIINGTINRFESELDKFAKQFGKDDLKSKPENQKIFSTLDELKKMNQTADLQNDEAARERYKKLLDQLLLDMANADDFKDSVADFAEMKVGLQLLAEGKRVYFPASENFTVADLIVMPDTTNITPKEGQSIEDVIAENLRFYAVTVTYVGGLSVKYKGGGGSANWDKIQQSEYKNPKTKDILLGIQSVYGLAYPAKKSEQNNISDKAITEYEAKIVQALDFAVKEGIISREEAEIIKQNGFEAANSTLNGALKDVPSCADKKGKKNFRKAVQMHHIMLQLTAVINNKDVLYTRFSNFNEEIKENSEGMAIGVIDDVADGVSRPCYMNPHHNPGFKISTDPKTGCINGAPTNQNPSHIESEMPKNLLKPKQKKSKKKSVREMIQSLPAHIKERIANRLKEQNDEMNFKVEKLKELVRQRVRK